jgi:hypothetical protein
MENERRLPLGLLLIFLFSLAVPLKMVPTFYGISARMEPVAARALAWRSAALAQLSSRDIGADRTSTTLHLSLYWSH